MLSGRYLRYACCAAYSDDRCVASSAKAKRKRKPPKMSAADALPPPSAPRRRMVCRARRATKSGGHAESEAPTSEGAASGRGVKHAAAGTQPPPTGCSKRHKRQKPAERLGAVLAHRDPA